MKTRENSTSCKKPTRDAFTKKYQHNKWLISLLHRTQSELTDIEYHFSWPMWKTFEQWGKRARVFETENLRVGFVYGDYKQGMGMFFIFRVYLYKPPMYGHNINPLMWVFKENTLKNI